MADVNITPRISCDNCAVTVDKVFDSGSWRKPKLWGSLKIEGGRTDSYGVKGQLAFTDLCQECALAAMNSASTALKARRGEERT
jgi:hypothetical protein